MKKVLLYSVIPLLALSACQPANDSSSALTAHEHLPDSMIIPVVAGREMVHNYNQKQRGSLQTSTPDSLQTQFVWIALDALEGLIDDAKKVGSDGVRIYFATYGTKEETLSYPEISDHAGMNTLVFVPTIDTVVAGRHIHWDHYIHQFTPQGKWRDLDEKVGVMNRGGICPPPRNCNIEGATLLSK
ncbi:hypothetical protein [Parapedobacter koreensis]|uniref:Uncharacterized protein n=1 Tax=Parapedobacter koreensis TaxID=332977 RepID=A0A1H7SX12_9SPHI|nr:hypothetical protein [Parapedobacter koreensis]SEL76077.1 hypothetical protein SAMN05421740_109200 [Parapedobacter koreensis]